ncbi:uncharacterized protein LOC132746071 [Ruditapes philippinarum]|uniref:uncharacterized protein LOC132746071 n=1 Tax=Ruditapes philippinarum TaxID=129788 RepID=UPI00295C15F8|nr:uncharacterized protein LOC132746071 [Ruditapes philippinarum]
MAESADIEMDIGHKVLIKKFIVIKKYMHPDPIIDCDTGGKLLTATDRRNMKNMDIREKKDKILRNVKSKGAKGYRDFEECLRKTGQTLLLKLMTCAKNGQDTKKIEDQLEKMPLLNPEYIQYKRKWLKKLIDHYRKTLLQVSATPLHPRGEKCSFHEIYIRPKITKEIKGVKGETEEVEVKTMSEIFTKNGVPQKSVYVLGDAGSGKTSFCKYLVNCWCVAHSPENEANNETEDDYEKHGDSKEKQGDENDDLGKDTLRSGIEESGATAAMKKLKMTTGLQMMDFKSCYRNVSEHELEFDGVNEMENFDFLFYVALRQNQNIHCIDEMLKKRYQTNFLSTLLDDESSRVIILLDGLDEWPSENIPEHSLMREYTIITTSRPWKVHTLSEVHIDHSLNLRGFDLKSEKAMVYRTISKLNDIRHDTKDSRNCLKILNEKSLVSFKQVPIMLQQLICLWFDGKLDNTTSCAIYTGMLELIFAWNDMKIAGKDAERTKGSPKIELPKYLADKNNCKFNSDFIYDVSKLAFETLFNCPKDKSLTFDMSVFDQQEISYDVRERCTKLGILTENECPNGTVSEPPAIMFSFIHKSIQEFLAAINIAINFKIEIGSSSCTHDVELQIFCMQFVDKVLQKCSTVNDILQQSNVISLLSGLEPQLATTISKYIRSIVSEDPRFHAYKKTIDLTITGFFERPPKCVTDIQKLIFDSMEECNACLRAECPVFYLEDLVISPCDQFCDCDFVFSSIDQQHIDLPSVNSIYVNTIESSKLESSKLIWYLPHFQHLEKIHVSFAYSSTGLSSKQHVMDASMSVVNTIRANISTLKSLSLEGNPKNKILYPMYTVVVGNLHNMTNLVAIKMTNITISHDNTTKLCSFLQRNNHLQQICLHIVNCECRNQHDLELSKHQHLQCLFLTGNVSVTDADGTALELLRFEILKNSAFEKIFDFIRKSHRLKELYLSSDSLHYCRSYHTNITTNLISALQMLHNLSKLELHDCRLTGNIIKLPLAMECLKQIDLKGVCMSLTTWKQFVDNLPCIPHTVYVSILSCCITGDGEEFNYDCLTLVSSGFRGQKRSDAIQYVKDREHLFYVYYNVLNFSFATKRVQTST